MATFATKYAPFDVKIVDVFRNMAIKSRPFKTTARIPMTVVKIPYGVILVSATPPGEAVVLLLNIEDMTPPVELFVIILGFPFCSHSGRSCF